MSFSVWIHQKVKDPVSGFTHLFGAGLGAVGLVFLLWKTAPANSNRHDVAAVVFGLSLIFLYLSSAAYHLLHVADKTRLILRRIDHALIFTLIAGTYTPFCLVTLEGPFGNQLLIAIWGIALAGLFLSIFWIHAPRWLTTALYLFMGWFIVFAIGPLKAGLTEVAFNWLVAGGLFYSVGAVIYAIKKPDPFPPYFGFHEIWHLMVLAGSASHFVSVAYALQ